MGLFKEVLCDECGKKAGMVFRVKLKDGKYLCSSCAGKIPSCAYHTLTSEYTMDMYHGFLDYKKYSDTYLRPQFVETHSYYTIHVDAIHKLFYIGYAVGENTVILQFRNIHDFDLVFSANEYKEGVIADKVVGKVLMELVMDTPYFRCEEVLDKSAKSKAEKGLFGSKIRYGKPKGMDVFMDVFLSLWKEALLEKMADDDAQEYAQPHESHQTQNNTAYTADASNLQKALALFMIDDISGITLNDLKTQRNRLIKTFHPDVSDAASTQYAQRINTAYEILKQALEQ